jgi:hypothetical protein
MTEDQYKSANRLRSVIEDIKTAIYDLSGERNYLGLPEEMYNRHMAEKLEYLRSELRKAESEFATL